MKKLYLEIIITTILTSFIFLIGGYISYINDLGYESAFKHWCVYMVAKAILSIYYIRKEYKKNKKENNLDN